MFTQSELKSFLRLYKADQGNSEPCCPDCGEPLTVRRGVWKCIPCGRSHAIDEDTGEVLSPCVLSMSEFNPWEVGA